MTAPHVRQRGSKWQVVWREGNKQPGKTFGTETEARNFAAIIHADQIRGNYFDPNAGRIKFKPFFDKWADNAELSEQLSPKTARQYRKLFQRLVEPTLGHISINKISKGVLLDWMRKQQEAGTGPTVIKATYHMIQSCMNEAVLTELIQLNPCSRELTKKLPIIRPTRKHTTLTPEEVRQLANTVKPLFKALVYTQAVLGLRPSEVVALRLGDVNLLERTITLRQVAVNDHGKMMVRQGTKNSKRTGKWEETLRMPQGLADILADHIRDFCENTTDDSELVFKAQRGGMLHTSFYNSDVLKKAGAAIGHPTLTEYDVRASGGTIAYGAAGPLFAQDLLRHSKLSMTMNHYITSNRSMDAQSEDAWSQAWFAK